MFEGKKITKATLKSFVKKNAGSLYIKKKRSFDGVVDGCIIIREGFSPVVSTQNNREHTLEITGAWLVNGSRDYFNAYQDDNFVGIEVYNCCGNFIIAIKKI